MDYDIKTYGDPVLREKAVKVKKVTDEIRSLAADMVRIMRDNNGIGLAAEQVGRNESICVVDVLSAETGSLEKPVVMLNPSVVESSGELIDTEGCLSFPDIFVSISRAAEITVKYMNLDGKNETCHLGGLPARVVLHEMDHLEGVLLVDRMSPVQKVAIAGKLKRLKKSWKNQ